MYYNVPVETIKKSPLFWSLITVAVLAFLLRVIGFGKIPVSPYWDEIAIWNDALSITETGRDLFNRSWFQPLFISYGDFKQPLYIWFTAIVSFFTTDVLIGVRTVSFLAGMSLIPGIWLLTRELFTEKKKADGLGILAALIVATMPWSMHFSRVGFEGHLGMAFFVWSIALLLRAKSSDVRRNSLALIIGSALLAAAAVYSYFSVRFVWPVAVIALVLAWWRNWKQRWWQLLIGAICWCALLVPLFQADFYQESNRFRLSASSVLNREDQRNVINLWRERSGNTVLSRVLYNRATFIGHDLFRNYLAFLDPSYLWISGDHNIRHGTGQVGIMLLASAPFFLIGIQQLIRKHRQVGFVLLFWWMAGILPAAVPLDVPHALRSLNVLPVYAIFIALGVFTAWKWCEKSQLWRVVLLSMFVLAGAELSRLLFTYQTVYAKTSAVEWQDGYIQVAEYVQTHRDQYVFVYVDNFDDRFFLYYQPYSGLSFAEIQLLPSENFRRTRFKNVILDNVRDWQFLEKDSLVITTSDRLPPEWKVKEKIQGRAGNDRFVVVETPKN